MHRETTDSTLAPARFLRTRPYTNSSVDYRVCVCLLYNVYMISGSSGMPITMVHYQEIMRNFAKMPGNYEEIVQSTRKLQGRMPKYQEFTMPYSKVSIIAKSTTSRTLRGNRPKHQEITRKYAKVSGKSILSDFEQL